MTAKRDSWDDTSTVDAASAIAWAHRDENDYDDRPTLAELEAEEADYGR